MFRGLFSEGFVLDEVDILSGSEDNLSGISRSLACFTARTPSGQSWQSLPLEKGSSRLTSTVVL
jgi:hypothetical protein